MEFQDQSVFHLPDTLEHWPWDRSLNPHYEKAKIHSSEWLRSFGAFSPSAQRAFDACDFNLLASLAYPTASFTELRIGCDLMNVFFVFDEYTDNLDGKGVRELADIVMDAIRHPDLPRPTGESVAGEITRQFWARAVLTASETCQDRFISSFDEYTTAVVQQAEDRMDQRLRTVEDYLSIRRETIGAKPSYCLLLLSLSLSDEVLDHPSIVELSVISIDLIIIGNDLCSYNVEQARGDDGHNLVTLVMNQYRFTLQQAIEWISDRHDELAKSFCEKMDSLPRWGATIDAQVRVYVNGLANWVRGNDCWSFESRRYFGNNGPEIMQSRVVRLLPRRAVLPCERP